MKHFRTALLSLAILMPATAMLHGQSSSPDAPLPSSILKAQKLFLANAGGFDNQSSRDVYNQFYAGLLSGGRFQLLDEPSSADLILELACGMQPVRYIPVLDSEIRIPTQCRLIILDPHSHVNLWTLTENAESARLESNSQENLKNAIVHLLTDFQDLGQPLPQILPRPPAPVGLKPSDPHQKTRFSQESPKG